MRTHGPITPTCPRCGYDQSGEVTAWTECCPVEGTCPECGESFAWAEAFQTRPATPAWSFEHAPGLLNMVRTPLCCVFPGLYWKRMGRSETVRIIRVLVLVIAWWAIVRGVLSVGLTIANIAVWIKPQGLTGWWRSRQYADSGMMIQAAEAAVFGRGPWESSDNLYFFAMSSTSASVSVAWLVLLLIIQRLGFLGRRAWRHLFRAWLMSLLALPVAYESYRLFRVTSLLPFMNSYGELLPQSLAYIVLFGPVVWTLAWWLRATRSITRRRLRLSGIALMLTSLCAGVGIHLLFSFTLIAFGT